MKSVSGIILFSALTTSRLWAFPCVTADSEQKTERRQIKAFDALRAKGAIDIEIRKDAEARVELSGPANYVAEVKTPVNGSELVIRSEHCLREPEKLKIIVYTPGLKTLASVGSADLQLVNAMMSGQTKIEMMGSGDLQGEVQSGHLELAVIGSGDMKLQGKVEQLQIVIKGSGDVKAENLEAHDVDITVSGSGDVLVAAADSLAVKIRGSGDVRYKGEPKVKNISSRGSGSVEKL